MLLKGFGSFGPTRSTSIFLFIFYHSYACHVDYFTFLLCITEVSNISKTNCEYDSYCSLSGILWWSFSIWMTKLLKLS